MALKQLLNHKKIDTIEIFKILEYFRKYQSNISKCTDEYNKGKMWRKCLQLQLKWNHMSENNWKERQKRIFNNEELKNNIYIYYIFILCVFMSVSDYK